MSRFTTVGVALVALISSPAWSQPLHGRGPVISHIRVAVSDLDLSQPAGADELLRRVAFAAARACGGQPAAGALMLEQSRAFSACKRKSLSDAIASVPAPLVQQRYAERFGAKPVEVAQARP